MIFVAGILVGILLSILSCIFTLFIVKNNTISTHFKQLESKFKKKGQIFDGGETEVEGWIDDLKIENNEN